MLFTKHDNLLKNDSEIKNCLYTKLQSQKNDFLSYLDNDQDRLRHFIKAIKDLLKSSRAVGTTIAIINTFAQIKELTRTVYQFAKAKKDEDKVKIFENSTSIMADLLDNELMVSQLETSLKIKLPFLEISRKITKVKK